MCPYLEDSGLNDVSLEINSLGTPAARMNYRAKLVDYFSAHKNKLDEDSLVRLEQNPLRILDSKNPDMKDLIESAPSMEDYLDAESTEHFTGLREILDAANIGYTVNPRLVRGLDYYGKTVFEWITNQLGAQGTICAGGRYDGLVEHHGANPTPAVGFAMGLERLLELTDFTNMEDKQIPHVYLILSGNKTVQAGILLAEELRDHAGIRIITHCGGGSIKSQFKKADKSGARLALILGEDELDQGQITIKFLRSNEEQITIKCSEVADFISKKLSI